MKLDVRYYLIAILFILFDLETAFFFPLAVSVKELGWTGFLVMLWFYPRICGWFWYIWKKVPLIGK